MKIALTVWGNRISPVFDSAGTLLVAEVKNGKVADKFYRRIDSGDVSISDILEENGIAVLICGAISRMSAGIILSSGIKLIPFITGIAADVLDLYVSDRPVPAECFMPGRPGKGGQGRLKDAALDIEETGPADSENDGNRPEKGSDRKPGGNVSSADP